MRIRVDVSVCVMGGGWLRVRGVNELGSGSERETHIEREGERETGCGGETQHAAGKLGKGFVLVGNVLVQLSGNTTRGRTFRPLPPPSDWETVRVCGRSGVLVPPRLCTFAQRYF